MRGHSAPMGDWIGRDEGRDRALGRFRRLCYQCQAETPHEHGLDRDGNRVATCCRCGHVNSTTTVAFEYGFGRR